MREASDLKDSVTEIDIEHISRFVLLYFEKGIRSLFKM